MRKRQSIQDLIDKNKQELLSNDGEIEKIERKLEDKHSNRL
ncbi:MAG TPA: FbpB family small basic protein [Bacillales bacterium]|nr:FbpB family small basic protein [Bacillales bacterium]